MTDSDRPHEYKPREVIPTPEQELRVGEGRISGNLAILLGVLSFLGVLCYRFPSYLTPLTCVPLMTRMCCKRF